MLNSINVWGFGKKKKSFEELGPCFECVTEENKIKKKWYALTVEKMKRSWKKNGRKNGETILQIVYKTKNINILEEYCQMKVCKNHH